MLPELDCCRAGQAEEECLLTAYHIHHAADSASLQVNGSEHAMTAAGANRPYAHSQHRFARLKLADTFGDQIAKRIEQLAPDLMLAPYGWAATSASRAAGSIAACSVSVPAKNTRTLPDRTIVDLGDEFSTRLSAAMSGYATQFSIAGGRHRMPST